MKRFAAILVLFVLGVSATADAAILDRIVARVNGEVITKYDVKQAALPYLLQEGRDPSVLQNPDRRSDVLKEVLQDMIDRRLLVQEAKKLDLKITDDELDKWMAFTRKQRGMTKEQFKQVIQQYGMKYDVYREMVRQNLLKIRMIKIKIGSQITITPDQVDEAYRKQYGTNGDEARYIDVAHILVRPKDDSRASMEAARAKAKAALARVRKGEAFEDVAADVSDGPAADKGGELGWFKKGELDPDFEKAAFALKPGHVSDVVQTKFGFHVIKVEDAEKRELPDLDVETPGDD